MPDGLNFDAVPLRRPETLATFQVHPRTLGDPSGPVESSAGSKMGKVDNPEKILHGMFYKLDGIVMSSLCFFGSRFVAAT